MAHTIRRVEYFHTSLRDEPGQAYSLLSQLAGLGLNLLAFTAIPVGAESTQITLFPDDPRRLTDGARAVGLHLDGPYSAFLVHGDDELGALAGIHAQLAEAGVNVYASSGVTDGRGSFGYVLYVKPADLARAVRALGL